MILAKLLLVIYIGFIVWICLRWRRSKFAVSGNEAVLMCIGVPVVLALEADAAIYAMRISICGYMFGLYIFWSRMLNKSMPGLMPYIGGCFLAFILMDVGALSFWDGYAGRMERYIVICSLSGLVPFLYLFVKRDEEKFLKNTISLGKIWKSFAGSFFFTGLSGATIIVMLYLDEGSHVAYASMVLLGISPLGYLYLNKPACLMFNEKEHIKKKAYILGRGIKDGQLLGEESGLMNETLVEDVRIIYNLITLFENERLYRNVDVKIGDVARMIGTNKTYLSRALNTRVSKNFCQFVNHYRIREVCGMYIEDTESDMRDLSEQCGFSSQSNFTHVFKYNTGYTPHDWCRLVKLKMERNEPVHVDDFVV